MEMKCDWSAVAGSALPGRLAPLFGLSLEKEELAGKVPSNSLPETPEHVLGVSEVGWWV